MNPDLNQELLEWQKVNEEFTLLDLKQFKKLNFTLANYQEYLQLDQEEQSSYQAYTVGWKDQLSWAEFQQLNLVFSKVPSSIIAYWKEKNTLPANQVELKQLKKKGCPANDHLAWTYSINDVALFADQNQGKKRSEIKDLNLAGNHLTGQLDLVGFTNLEKLDCAYNPNLTGSLAIFQHLTKLKKLDISSTDFFTGLQHLPTSLEEFDCSGTKLEKELELYNNNLLTWQEAHPDLMRKVGREIKEGIDYSNSQLIITINHPEFSEEDNDLKLNPNPELTNLGYSKFILQDIHSFNYQAKNTSQSLPLRLYNLATNQVETTTDHEIDNYLILSYCWGTEWEKNPQSYGQTYSTDLTKLGRKSLNKVKAFYQNHKDQGIPTYIWIDNFCINQTNNIEKGNEVKNQKNYYSNAVATLVAVDAEIGHQIDQTDEFAFAEHLLALITRSDWFTRAWTFQEGVLSKQTIFMFDDYLVDGRILAQYWGSIQQEYDETETTPNPIIHITPFGWSYGAQPNQTINLTLGQALHAIHHRSQTVPVDGIYSFLGLLPYGDQVKIKYREDNNYTITYLENAFAEVIKVAVQNGHYADLFSWSGSRNNNLMPMINNNGSTKVKNLIDREQIEIIKEKIISITANTLHCQNVVISVVKKIKIKRDKILIELAAWKIEIVKSNDLIINEQDTVIIFNLDIEDSLILSGNVLIIPTTSHHPLYLCEWWTGHSYSIEEIEKFNLSKEVLLNLSERTIIAGAEVINAYQTIQSQQTKLFNSIEKKLKTEVKETLNQLLSKVTVNQLEQQSLEWNQLITIAQNNDYLEFSNDLIKLSQLQLQLNQLIWTEDELIWTEDDNEQSIESIEESSDDSETDSEIDSSDEEYTTSIEQLIIQENN